jgi:predicted membrane channel-forming protein YqfA (hemolysin III family)
LLQGRLISSRLLETDQVVRSGSTALFLPLYLWIHLPIAIAAVADPEILADSALGDALRGAISDTLQGSLCGVAGYALMVAKLPERLAPGWFDTWGHSHQWWHVLTMVGPVWCLEAGRLIIAARLDHSCPA